MKLTGILIRFDSGLSWLHCLAAALVFLAVPGTLKAQSAPTVSARLVDGDPAMPGEIIKVALEISGVDDTIAGYSFRVRWPHDSLAYSGRTAASAAPNVSVHLPAEGETDAWLGIGEVSAIGYAAPIHLTTLRFEVAEVPCDYSLFVEKSPEISSETILTLSGGIEPGFAVVGLTGIQGPCVTPTPTPEATPTPTETPTATPSPSPVPDPLRFYLEPVEAKAVYVPGEEIALRLGADGNETGLLPSGYNVYLEYPAADFEYVGCQPGAGGWTPGVAPAEANGDSLRHVISGVNTRVERPLNPLFGTLKLRVKATAGTESGINLVVFDPEKPENNLVASSNGVFYPLDYTFDISAVQGFAIDHSLATPSPSPTPAEPTPTPFAGLGRVTAELVEGNPGQPGDQLRVRVTISHVDPVIGGYSMRLRWPEGSVAYEGFDFGDANPNVVLISPGGGSSDSVLNIAEVSVSGYQAPFVVGEFLFNVGPGTCEDYFIAAERNPEVASLPLLTQDSEGLDVEFLNIGLDGLQGPCPTPSPTATATPTVTPTASPSPSPSPTPEENPVRFYIEPDDTKVFFRPGDEAGLRFGVDQNTTGLAPAGYNVYVCFPSADFEYVRRVSGDSGWYPNMGAIELLENGLTRLSFYAININARRPLEPVFGKVFLRVKDTSAEISHIDLVVFDPDKPENNLVTVDGADLSAMDFFFDPIKEVVLRAPTPTPSPTPTASPTPTPTPSPTPTASPSPTPTPSPSPSPTPSPTDTPTPTPSLSPSPTETPTPSPSPSPTPSPTPTETPTLTPSPTLSPTETPTATATPTASPEPSPTETPEPSPTATPEPTETPTPTASPSPTVTPTETPEPTATPEPTETPSPSPSETPTASPSPTETPEPSPTRTPTPTASPTPTATVTPSPSPTAAVSPTPSPSPTPYLERNDIVRHLLGKTEAAEDYWDVNEDNLIGSSDLVFLIKN